MTMKGDQLSLIDVGVRLTAAMRRHCGTDAHIENLVPTTLGGSNRTILFDLKTGISSRRLVLRQESVPPDYTPFLPSAVQWEVVSAAFRHGVLVPEPIMQLKSEDGLGDGFIMAAVDGESLPKRLLNEPRFATARERFLDQAGVILASLHGIDTHAFAVLEQWPESGDPIEAQLGYYDRYGLSYPAMEYVARWLMRNRPSQSTRVPVHGDFRNGNMLVDETGIRAVLDWECAHLGDHHEDFGWFCTRSWRFGHNDRPAGGFGSRETLYQAYEQAGGRSIDRDAARWWEIFGLLRWANFNIMQVYGHISGRRRSPRFAACGRNICLMELDMLRTIAGQID